MSYSLKNLKNVKQNYCEIVEKCWKILENVKMFKNV